MPRDYDDDDRPRSRRYRDEDPDDRPRSRRPSRDDSEDDDRPRRKRPRQFEDDYDDRPRRRKRPKQKQQSILGMVALIIGIASVFIAFVPCLGILAILPGLAGLIIGFIGLLIAHKSDGRQGSGLPIAGTAVCAFAVIVAACWLIFIKNWSNEVKKDIAAAEAEMAREEEQRKAEVAKAASEVKAAQPESVIRVGAPQFYWAFENDDERTTKFYRNKIIEVTGVIQAVSLRGEVYTVSLQGGGAEGGTVDCHFLKDPEIRAQLNQLTVGRTVTIRGKCIGGFSDLEGCMLVGNN
jgi:tRNA_anti-like